MLVLSRKTGEKICIGDNITITVTQAAGNRIKLGIEAPKSVSIVRGEIHRLDANAEQSPELSTKG